MRFFLALIPLFFLTLFLSYNIYLFKDTASDGPNQLVLLFSAFFTGFLGFLFKKTPYEQIEKKIFETLSSSLYVIIFVLLIGFLMSSWVAGGVIPSLVYYGLKILHPKIFLPAITLICALVSFTIGSSWSTGATLGVAFMGMGELLGFDKALVAGAIISGCYFGNTFSPFSETSVLACELNGAHLSDHSKHTAKLSFITLFIVLLLYFFIGLLITPKTGDLESSLTMIGDYFTVSWIPLLIPPTILFLILLKVPSLIALSTGALLGVLSWLFLQPGVKSYAHLVDFLLKGQKISIPDPLLEQLFSGGGVYGLFSILLLIITAIIFGGAMEASGFLEDISKKILQHISGYLSLMAATLFSGILFNGLLSDDYLSIIVTSKIYRPLYEEFQVVKKELTRAIQASSTVTAGLVPWCTGGAFFTGILGVNTKDYAPYSFYNILCPLICFILAYLKIRKDLKKVPSSPWS